jgi:hypothetical protein
MESFAGYHSEWNLGSPGGWDYQRMTQEIGRACWERVRSLSGIELELDFDHPLLNPLPGFLEMLLRAQRKRHGTRKAFILVVAEEDTLEAVVENRNLARALNAVDGVSAALCAPHDVESSGGRVCYRGEEVTLIFMDFNTDTLLKIHKKKECSGLFEAIRQGILVNPRGMEAINPKGIFEVVTGPYRDRLSRTTVERTPWTRRFFARATTAPDGAEIRDIVEWTRRNREGLVLKPAHGYSGHGVFVGPLRSDWNNDIEQALKEGDYIVQQFIPMGLWKEEQPWLDEDSGDVVIREWQTDFRCFITDVGLIGFVGRFGGVPTNVGSGGGVQSLAILRGSPSVGEATRRINEAVYNLGKETVAEIRDWTDRMAVEHGLTYLLGPIMTALRPRLITPEQLVGLQAYSQSLWEDCKVLEEGWRRGEISDMLEESEEAREIFRLQPWQGRPALIASDGLFGFGAQLEEGVLAQNSG